MKRVLTAVILIPIVVLALFRAPLWLFTLLVLGVALLAAKEYFGIARAQGFRTFQVLGFALVAWLPIALFVIMQAFNVHALLQIYLYLVVTPLVLVAFVLLVSGLQGDSLAHVLPDAAITYMALPYVAIPLSLMIVLSSYYNGALFLLYLMLLVWCGDIAAYYVGRAIGKHKLAPRISPGKTWEGSIASVIGAVIVGSLLFHYITPIAQAFRRIHLLLPVPGEQPLRLAPIWFVALFAICVNVAAQLGDLVESALKRGAGVKDSGTLLPGHGGVLDRIDALLFALPVGLIFYIAGMDKYFSYPPYVP